MTFLFKLDLNLNRRVVDDETYGWQCWHQSVLQQQDAYPSELAWHMFVSL